MKSNGYILRGLSIIFSVVVLFLSCDNASGGSGGSTTVSLNQMLVSLPASINAQIPESLENAKGANTPPSASILTLSVNDFPDGGITKSVYGHSSEIGVISFGMWDLLYNWLLDKADPDPSATPSMGVVFIEQIKKIADTKSLSIDQNNDLGQCTLTPTMSALFDDAATYDLGSMMITKPSDSETMIRWSVDIGSNLIDGADFGGIYSNEYCRG